MAAAGPASRHNLDDATLGRYLESRIPGLKWPVVSTKIGYGQSNPTYFVDDAAGQKFILRKKPSGTIISPVAHQVDREFQVLQALGTANFPVPKVYCLCEDTSIIGTSFYVMQFVKGRIIIDPELGELSPAERREAWFSFIDTLAHLHSLPPASLDLTSFGNRGGADFYRRHCKTFARIEAQQALVKDKDTSKPLGRAHSRFDEVVNFVRRNAPDDRCCVVHGDFKFDNMILHPSAPSLIAVLDWELSTLGHPLLDVVYALSPYWFLHPDFNHPKNPYRPDNQAKSGMPSIDELLDRYTKRAGFDPRTEGEGKSWEVAKVFHLMRGATIAHGIQARTISGQASSEFSHRYFEQTKRNLDAAVAMMEELEQKWGQEGSGGERSKI